MQKIASCDNQILVGWIEGREENSLDSMDATLLRDLVDSTSDGDLEDKCGCRSSSNTLGWVQLQEIHTLWLFSLKVLFCKDSSLPTQPKLKLYWKDVLQLMNINIMGNRCRDGGSSTIYSDTSCSERISAELNRSYPSTEQATVKYHHTVHSKIG